VGRRTMTDLKNIARFVALIALVLWCVTSVGAVQQRPQTQPPQTRPQPQWQRKPMPANAGAVHTHPTVRPSGKMIAARPRHAERRLSAEIPAKRVTTPKPQAAPAKPAIPSAVALADQTPALPETGHGRDPFAALIRASDPDSHTTLPPGIAGLQVATMRLEGMVKTPDGMVAVVSNPEDSVYFLHDGDHIYDGVVTKIGIDGIMFRQESKDAFGRTVDRDVSKRLYPIAGEEQ
jgi:hypothetical protein